MLQIFTVVIAGLSAFFAWQAAKAAIESVDASSAALRLQNTPFVEPISVGLSGSRVGIAIVNRGPSPAFNVVVRVVVMPDGTVQSAQVDETFLGVGEEFSAVIPSDDRFDELTAHIQIEYQDLIGRRYVLTRLPWPDPEGNQLFTYRFVRLNASGDVVEEMLRPRDPPDG